MGGEEGGGRQGKGGREGSERREEMEEGGEMKWGIVSNYKSLLLPFHQPADDVTLQYAD